MLKAEVVDHIQEFTRAYDLTKEEYIIIGSSVLAMIDDELPPPDGEPLRQVRDIDIVVGKGIFGVLKQSDGWEMGKYDNGCLYVKKDVYEVSTCWTNGSGGLWVPNELNDSRFELDGIPFIKPETLAFWKAHRGTSKDLDDIRRINRYLAYYYESQHTRQNTEEAIAVG